MKMPNYNVLAWISKKKRELKELEALRDSVKKHEAKYMKRIKKKIQDVKFKIREAEKD